jgi:hypothetical protein
MKHRAYRLLVIVAIACLAFPLYAIPIRVIKILMFPLPPGDDSEREFSMAILVFMSLGLVLLILAGILALFIDENSTKEN